ncbi:MAG: hypothetical protein ACKPCM_18525 [Pseudanabaena sp.]
MVAPSPPTKPDRLNLNKSNSDRPLPPTKPIAYSPHQTAIAYFSISKSDRLFLHIKKRSPLNTHKTRSPKSQNQTAINRLSTSTKLDRLNLNIKQRSPLTPTKPDRLSPQNQTAIYFPLKRIGLKFKS